MACQCSSPIYRPGDDCLFRPTTEGSTMASIVQPGVSFGPVSVPIVQSVEALKLAGETARREGRQEDAERLLAQAVSLEPQNALLWFERGTIAFAAGLLDKALEYYRRAAELDRSLGEAHLNVGGVLEQLERQ